MFYIYILYSTFILLLNYMGRCSHCYTDVQLNKQDEVQILYYYKYRGKLGRQNVITQAGVWLNTGVNKVVV